MSVEYPSQLLASKTKTVVGATILIICSIGLLSFFGFSLVRAVMQASAPAPTITFTISPQSVAYGQCATVSWQTENASSVSITGPGFGTLDNNNETMSVNGSKVVCPIARTNYYTLFARGQGGYRSSRVTLLGTNMPTTQQIKVAVVITKAPGEPDPSAPTSTINEMLGEVKNFLRENSYGLANVTWDIYGPFASTGTPGYSPNYWAVADPSVDFRRYTHVLSIDERNPSNSCHGASACAGKNTNITFLQDNPVNLSTVYLYSYFVQPASDIQKRLGLAHGVLTHEFGHSLGFDHADLLNCGNQQVDSQENCTTRQERFDIMGTMVRKGHYNVANKETAGWATEANGKIKRVAESGVYRLYAFENYNIAPIGLKLPRRLKTQNCDTMESSKDFYYLEFRTARGYDGYVVNYPNSAPVGPQIRSFTYSPDISNGYNNRTLNVDLTPQDTYPNDNNAITADIPFNDPIRGMTIAVEEITNDYVDVRIDLGNMVCGTN